MKEFQILHKLIHIFKEKEIREFERTGLSGKELYVLQQIRTDDPWRFNDFAEHYSIKPSTLTGIISRLENKGLVKRERTEKDRKAVYLNCTSSGRDLGKQHIEEDQLFFCSLLATLEPQEKEQFIGLTKKIIGNRELCQQEE